MKKLSQFERNNPCLKEYKQSSKCLANNNYDRDKCEEFFENYNSCKSFWGKVQTDRRIKGITPLLPEYEDRPRIKEEYIKNAKS